MKIYILGGGLAGVSLAYFLQNDKRITRIDILEKNEVLGGLCRSFKIRGIYHDIGPHIIFSKDKEILDLMVRLLGKNKNKLRRSNKIFYKGKFVKYPFENELSALAKKDREYCLNTFLNNPYESYEVNNILQFFLKTFGEGITDTYLRPYNEKIWKFDPSFMDTQMVARIPNPHKEDILKSANGVATEGYLHQLHFYYPKEGGINSLIKGFTSRFNKKINIFVENEILTVDRFKDKWDVKTDKKVFKDYDLVISTIPVQTLIEVYNKTSIPKKVIKAVKDLKYNSIVIACVNVKKDNLSNNFAITVPDKDIIFHRVSKLNFLGDTYCRKDGSTTLMVEITYRANSIVDKMNDEAITKKIVNELEKVKFINSRWDVNFIDIKRLEYAYVIYDLNHRKNMDLIKKYFTSQGIKLCGRFGEFEYLNMDTVIKYAKELSKKIGKTIC